MMYDEKMIRRVLAAYPPRWQPSAIHALGARGGLSGSRFWRVETAEGNFLLRRWPKRHFTLQHLQFIQAVLWQADVEGVPGVRLPVETSERKGVVCEDGSLWELWPEMPGRVASNKILSAEQRSAAVAALAAFHEATCAFPLPILPQGRSPGVRRMLERWKHLLRSGLHDLSHSLQDHVSPPMAQKSRKLLHLITRLSGNGMTLLTRAARLSVRLQPCWGDARREHLFFEGNRVTGLIDFEAMRADSIAADIARLLGSIAGNDRRRWQEGLEEYQRRRSLTDAELYLVTTFDRLERLIEAAEWMHRFYCRRQSFTPDQLTTLLGRFDRLLRRLEFQEEFDRSLAA